MWVKLTRDNENVTVTARELPDDRPLPCVILYGDRVYMCVRKGRDLTYGKDVLVGVYNEVSSLVLKDGGG